MGGLPFLAQGPAGVKRASLLAQCPALRDLGLVRPLSGGGSWNETWLATRGGERMVVRFDTPAARALGLDRATEVAALDAIRRRGIGPQLVFADPRGGTLVTRWLPGRACAPAMLRNPRLLQRLGALLRRLHRSVAPPRGAPPLDLAHAADRYAAIVGSLWARREACAAARSFNAGAGRGSDRALCHNDPVAQNLILGPHLRLIDWEFAAPGDPLFDVAVAVGHHRLSGKLARILLAAARGRVYAADWRGLKRLVAGYGHLLALWDAAVRCESARAPKARPGMIVASERMSASNPP